MKTENQLLKLILMTQKQIYCKIARKDTSTLSRIRNVVEISHKNERLGLSETQLDVNHIEMYSICA